MHRQDLPKPFLMLGGKPIVIHTLEQFFVNPKIDRIILVAPAMWRVYAEDLLSKYDSMGKPAEVIAGGVNKTESIRRMAEHIGRAGSAGDDILLLHDAIRPFVSQRVIDDCIDAAARFGAANTVTTTNDTIVTSEDGVTMTDIPQKNRMLAEQTPQAITLRLLGEVFEKAERQGVPFEQESEFARLLLRYGVPVRLVRGEYSNMKIINPYDLEIAAALLEEKGK